jgi:hypothetical protein
MSQARPPAAPAGDPIETLGSVGVIPVVVIDDAARAAPLAEALAAGGIHAADVSDDELARRRAEWSPPATAFSRGYVQLYVQHVQQGAGLDFLVGSSGSAVPRDNH